MIQNLSFKYVVNRLLHTFDIGQGMHRLPCNYSKIDVVKEPKNTLNRAETDFIMAQIPCLLPAREGPRFWVEPYFPDRFARLDSIKDVLHHHLRFLDHAERLESVQLTGLLYVPDSKS